MLARPPSVTYGITPSARIFATVARARTVARRAVIDGQQGQAVFFVDDFLLVQEPLAIGRGNIGVRSGSLIPAPVERLERNDASKIVKLRQQFETALEDESCIRVTRLDPANDRDETRALTRPAASLVAAS
jgi:hypothetical protein